MKFNLPSYAVASPAAPYRWFSSCLVAFLVFLAITMFMRGGFEKYALHSPHDDLYFLERSERMDHNGSHLAFIKEYPYSYFIKVGRTLGLPLWDFELLTYCLALVVLWRQFALIFRSYALAWGVVLPLCFFPYLHYVFQRATYDSLQLIFTPLAFATALGLLRSEGAWRWIVAAGLASTVQLATRPEGFIFLFPVLLAGGYLWLRGVLGELPRWWTRAGLWRTGGLLVISLSLPIFMSLFHAVVFGFRAQTIMKTDAMQTTLSLLMQVDPGEEDGGRFAPFPISAMEKAMAVSPALARTRTYFERNTGGRGWSGSTGPRERTLDLSISGGHFQWAWLDASAYASGRSPREIQAFNREVAAELEAAFARGELPRRRLLTTALGPNFSLFSRHYWSSVWALSKDLLHLSPVRELDYAYGTGSATLDYAYDRLALRRHVWVRDRDWGQEGWILGVAPDHEAPVGLRITGVDPSKVSFKVVDRPDVRTALRPDLEDAEGPFPIGFELMVRDAAHTGWVVAIFPDREVRIPVESMRYFLPRRTNFYEDLQIRIDRDYGGFATATIARHMTMVKGWFGIQHQIARWAILLSPLVLGGILWSIWRESSRRPEAGLILGILVAAAGVFGLFLALLAGIDAFMYPGDEPRYLAPAAFSLWMAMALLYGLGVREILLVRRAGAKKSSE